MDELFRIAEAAVEVPMAPRDQPAVTEAKQVIHRGIGEFT